MVEQLADKKMNLEERVSALEEEVADLEQLVDMNEQLVEGARELEVELREEADMARAAMREVNILWSLCFIYDHISLRNLVLILF